MHRVFAVEPQAINNWRDFRYVMEKFGYSEGVLVACYPKKWPRMVIEACKKNGIQGIEFSRIVEKLNEAKADRLRRFALDYDPAIDWLDNAVTHAASDRLDAILARNADGSSDKIHAVVNVEEDLFCGHREVSVRRDAATLAAQAEALIRGTKSLVLVDPYFRPRRSCVKVLQSLFAFVDRQGFEVIIHAAYSKHPVSTDDYKREFDQQFQQKVGMDISLRLVRWSDDSLDFDLHARYLLTEYGGLRYDRGFNEPPDHNERAMATDVVCMDQRRKHEVEEQFSDFETNENVHDIVELL